MQRVLIFMLFLSSSQILQAAPHLPAPSFPRQPKDKAAPSLPHCNDPAAGLPCQVGPKIESVPETTELGIRKLEGQILVANDSARLLPFKFVSFTLSSVSDKSFAEIEGAADQHGKFLIQSPLADGEYLLTVKTSRCACSQKITFAKSLLHKNSATLTINCCEKKLP